MHFSSLMDRLCFGGKRFDWANVSFAAYFILSRQGHNQIWICNFLHCDWFRPQPKHWFDRQNTKFDRNVEAKSAISYGWDVPWRKVTACKPINQDDFMRLSVRFTNIKMIMIEEGFCKNAWTSDIKRPEATRRHRSKGKSREFEYLKYWYILSGKV